MAEYFNLSTNSAKRLPIVFCLDVSPSMGWIIDNNSSAIELLNAAVQNFINELKEDNRCRNSAEIAFVTFSSEIEMNTDFESISTIQAPVFKPVAEGGSSVADAVICSIEKIKKRREELIDSEIGYYAPFLVIVTDGDPDSADDPASTIKALNLIKKHCDSHIGAREIIVPFVIGVGDYIGEDALNNYAQGFTDGYFPIKGNAKRVGIRFNSVFQMIGNSTKKSIHLNARGSEILGSIQKDMNTLLTHLSSI